MQFDIVKCNMDAYNLLLVMKNLTEFLFLVFLKQFVS